MRGRQEGPARPTLSKPSPRDLSLPILGQLPDVTADGMFPSLEPRGSWWVLRQLRNCTGKCWFLLVLLPAPTFSAGLHQKADLCRPAPRTGPAGPAPADVSPTREVRSLELLWKSTPSCIFSKDVKINFLKRIQGKAAVVFVYGLLLWDLLDILQGFQPCTSGKYLFLVI